MPALALCAFDRAGGLNTRRRLRQEPPSRVQELPSVFGNFLTLLDGGLAGACAARLQSGEPGLDLALLTEVLQAFELRVKTRVGKFSLPEDACFLATDLLFESADFTGGIQLYLWMETYVIGSLKDFKGYD